MERLPDCEFPSLKNWNDYHLSLNGYLTPQALDNLEVEDTAHVAPALVDL
jgi:hypothetical protein